MESGVGPGKLWKMNQMITAFTYWTVKIVDFQFSTY